MRSYRLWKSHSGLLGTTIARSWWYRSLTLPQKNNSDKYKFRQSEHHFFRQKNRMWEHTKLSLELRNGNEKGKGGNLFMGSGDDGIRVRLPSQKSLKDCFLKQLLTFYISIRPLDQADTSNILQSSTAHLSK